MGVFTTNWNLFKMGEDDPVDIVADFNDNMDKIESVGVHISTAQTITGLKSIERATTATTALRFLVTGDTFSRLHIRADGQIELGSGSATQDLLLLRGAANRFDVGTGAAPDDLRVTQDATVVRSLAVNDTVGAGAGSILKVTSTDTGLTPVEVKTANGSTVDAFSVRRGSDNQKTNRIDKDGRAVNAGGFHVWKQADVDTYTSPFNITTGDAQVLVGVLSPDNTHTPIVVQGGGTGNNYLSPLFEARRADGGVVFAITGSGTEGASHIRVGGTAPAITAGAGLGTGGTATLAGANDVCGTCVLTFGTSITAGTIATPQLLCTVTFAKTDPSGRTPRINYTPTYSTASPSTAKAATAGLILRQPPNTPTTGLFGAFEIYTTANPATAPTNADVYLVTYMVMVA